MRQAGVVRAEEEARALAAHASGDVVALDEVVARRASGEPLARILRRVDVGGITLRLDPGVYVPRWTTGWVARAAAAHLPATGVAVDLCTGSGAVAAVLLHERPEALVVATDLDPASVRCARANGVDARLGDLFEPLPPELGGTVDVVVAVAPFVPTESMRDLPADVRANERAVALDGGAGGLEVIERIIRAAPGWLRPGAALVLEMGADQLARATALLGVHGFDGTSTIVDGDGDPCGLVARRGR